MTDLLPCPFCGSTNLRHEFAGSQGFIECNECGTAGPCDERAADPICDYDAAYAAWNRRAAAQADGPAVPEGREPASVVSEPSDEELLEEGPSLEEVEELCEEHCFNVEGYESIECLQGLINDALARWGTPNQAEIGSSLGAAPAPPDEGEVGELVADELVRRLRTKAATEKSNRCHYSAILLTRAADLLEQRHPAPVPVSERLPGPGDLNDKGWCWVLYRGFATWALEPPLGQDGKPTGYTHWLPFTALPLPAGEVEP